MQPLRVMVLALVSAAAAVGAQPVGRPVRVLLLFQQQAETRPMLDLAERVRQTLGAELDLPVQIFQEGLDFDRFGDRHLEPLLTYLDHKYRGAGIDVVIPVGSQALRFAIERLDPVLSRVPIVFALCAQPQTDSVGLPPNVTGRLAPAFRFGPTIEMARALQPDAQRIIIIGGAGPKDSSAVAAAIEGSLGGRPPLPLMVLQGRELDDLLHELRRIPRRSIVVFASYRFGPRGPAFEPFDIVGSLAHASAAPMYTQVESYIGEGVVGGSVTSFTDEGDRTARLVARVLRRHPGERLPAVERIENRFVVDWRQLKQWKLSEDALPPDTRQLFREPSPWQRYRSIVLGVLAVLSAEGILIAMLLRERGRRRLAQVATEDEHRRAEAARRQVSHLGRVALAGELAATLSHELRQPLTAILVNAQSGLLLIKDDSAECREAREIFESIAADDKRAVRLIDGVRKLVRNEEPATIAVDLNQIAREAVALLRYDARARGTLLDVQLCDQPMLTLGDPAELQQVVLNLLLNALDAASTSQGERQVVIRTITAGSEVEIQVRDTGPGIAPLMREHLFEAFASTKRDGLGLGLAIVRSIVERHGGRITADSDPGVGAVFSVFLPRVDASSPVVAPNAPRVPVMIPVSISDGTSR